MTQLLQQDKWKQNGSYLLQMLAFSGSSERDLKEEDLQHLFKTWEPASPNRVGLRSQVLVMIPFHCDFLWLPQLMFLSPWTR